MDEGYRFAKGRAEVERVNYGVAVVSHHYQGSMGQPTAQLQDHLPGPVGEFLVAASLLLVIAFRGGQLRGGQFRGGQFRGGQLRGASTVRKGKAQYRPAQGMCPSHINATRRRPLALTV